MKRPGSLEAAPVRSFVVRIYRSAEAGGDGLLGTVQPSEAAVALRFASPEELIRILKAPSVSERQTQARE